ncbi:hypothetical protein Q9233_006341 [Columba guinea]|nr:hypothetical protein Q9233_006341 [Columba guinea]
MCILCAKARVEAIKIKKQLHKRGLSSMHTYTGDAPGHRPFQCRYCPYSASQKGNLKTHVLCVHRMPFDNSQYPDRRFKRSRVDSEASGNLEEPAAVKAGSSAELAEEGGKAQE